MRKTLTILGATVLLFACNVSVDEEQDKDSATRFDSFLQKADTALDNFGDSAKARYKDIKEDVKERIDDDSSAKKLR